jgi:7-cyano-7-deazaguanine reductase
MNRQTADNPAYHSLLGKTCESKKTYSPEFLFTIPRQFNRSEIGIESDNLPFRGEDIWTGYELSWLNLKGKPVAATALFYIPANTEFLIESKAFKLYLNSFSNTHFASTQIVVATLEKDLSKAAGGTVKVALNLVEDPLEDAICLDNIDITCDTYLPNEDFLVTEIAAPFVKEILYSHLLKSNCLVTTKPDWGSVYIYYSGKKINHEGLLRYIVSLRNHNEFHEPCVERIYQAILKRCEPELLTVYARYTRRGGLDINPYRTNDPSFVPFNIKLSRQ